MKILRTIQITWVPFVLLIGVISGCAGQTSSSGLGETSDTSTNNNQEIVEEVVEDEPIVASSVPASPGFTEETLVTSSGEAQVNKRPAVPIYYLDIPFNFDKASLREDALTYVEVNAIRIQDEKAGKVLLEGRADEIGTLEYNFVLGERRARAVREHLIRLGFDPDTFVITSYGKVKPLCNDHNAECWQVNRSVRFESE